ncbi:hypothetical protein [Puniceibacterium sediminis]|uniref:Uncharacterized protein n=1 Tax=Puniceibacterium sediminis TaxID=1608407 RepID=A0A238WR84_9RHOB|nr:hypothetical protein [Puniceibacterium sediminis]SNR48928.1 hypothetical protein SAMN06265370_1076 [Puniceibacterium sediminis]
MQTSRTQIGDVTYNAATQSFEALVTFHTKAGRVRVAAEFHAPLSEDFEVVTESLWQDALDRRRDPLALHARLEAHRVITRRNTAHTMPPLQRWFEALIGHDAA